MAKRVSHDELDESHERHGSSFLFGAICFTSGQRFIVLGSSFAVLNLAEKGSKRSRKKGAGNGSLAKLQGDWVLAEALSRKEDGIRKSNRLWFSVGCWQSDYLLLFVLAAFEKVLQVELGVWSN
jgi:hypothetical protein